MAVTLNPPTPTRGTQCPPAGELERLAVGERVAQASTEHVDSCNACSHFLTQLRQGDEVYRAAHPPERFLAQLDRRQAATPRSLLRFLPHAGLAAAAVAIATVMVPSTGPEVRLKGSLLSVHLQRVGAPPQIISPETELKRQDALRFTVRAPGRGFAAVFERDGNGKVTVVAPFGAMRPQAVMQGSTTLDDSAVLDASPGPERFVAVFSPGEFDVGTVRRQLEASPKDIDCAGCAIEVVEFKKAP